MSPVGVETIIGTLPKQQSFTIVSLFVSGLVDFDNNIDVLLTYMQNNIAYITQSPDLAVDFLENLSRQIQDNINVYNLELIEDQTFFAEDYLVHHYCKLCSGYSNII